MKLYNQNQNCEIYEILTNGNDHDKNETQSDIIEELSQIETDNIVLNERTTQPITSEEINLVIESNQNEILKHTTVDIEPGPSSLRKVEWTPFKKYMYM